MPSLWRIHRLLRHPFGICPTFFLCLFRNVISKLNPYSFINPTHPPLTYPPKIANHAYLVAGVELFCQYHKMFCQSLCFTEKEMRWPRRRTLVVLAGLPTICFDFFNALCSLIGAKKYSLVSQRGIKDDSI